ncbi:MAG: flavodoxin family protein [Lachnospiraceae bacterium]|nr:flavodoxin family protein [Lachnospiraceae bacterium]
MKVLAMTGSPNQKGSSTTLVNQILAGAKAAGHEVEELDVETLSVNGCKECMYCRTNNADCIQQDDLKDYWDKLRQADVLIVSSPNYYSTVTGPMITFMNRHYCLKDASRNSRIPGGKKLIGVFSQGNPDEQGYVANYDWYLNCFASLGMEVVDKLICTGTTSLEEDSEMMKRAFNLGKNL